MIHEVIKDFRLAKKVKFIVTDNGANICKAVKIIQEEKKKAAQKKRLDAGKSLFGKATGKSCWTTILKNKPSFRH